MTARDDDEGHGGIQSLDLALGLLRVLAAQPGPVGLSDLARLAGMPPSKAHRYLASFAHAGLVAQRGRSGRYDLGKGAVELGLAAMARYDLVNRAADRLEDLVEATGAAALLAVWGNAGPTVVRWQRTASFVFTSLGLGTTLPLLNSATGRIFLAFAPKRMVAPMAEQELARAARLKLSWPDLMPTKAALARMIEGVREAGHAAVDGRFIPGLNAISAPVLNWQGEAEAALTITSPDPGLLDDGGPAMTLLRDACRDLSVANSTEPVPR